MNEIEDLAVKAEAFLFTAGGPISLKKLSRLIESKDAGELSAALAHLSEKLKGGGISLILTDAAASLSVSPQASPAVQKSFELELTRDIGDAGLEVLAILLYRGPSTRANIDYIRGVNSSTTLRTLLARGLILRGENPRDSREYLYRPSLELLAHLGVDDVKKIPDYDKISGELASFEIKQDPIRHENGDTTATVNDAAPSS